MMLDIGRSSVDVELQLPASELGAALRLPLAERPAAVVGDYGSVIARYVAGHLTLRATDGQAFSYQQQSLFMRHTDNALWTSNDWVVLRARFDAPPGASTGKFALDYTVIVDRVLSHQALVYVRRDIRNAMLGDQPVLIATIGFGQTHGLIDGSSGSWWAGFSHLLSMGMRHIATGVDHLLFLIALLLPAALVARGGRWTRGHNGGAMVHRVVSVVTGFTLGHSLTLALVATEVIQVSSRVVESLIAVSVFVSAWHAWRPIFPGREHWVATTFGLVHGMAFADVLSGLQFDTWSLVVSLMGFNLGIELMQLVVLAMLLPILLALCSSTWEAWVRRSGAAIVGVCALGWLANRAAALRDPLQPLTDWLAAPPPWFPALLCAVSVGALVRVLAQGGLRRWMRGTTDFKLSR